MIKRTKKPGTVDVIEYVCDNCTKVMPGQAIEVFYPYGHLNDSESTASHFCSDKCLVEFETKFVKKYGSWKSEALSPEKKVRSSAEWREGRAKKTDTTAPKARRATNRRKSKNSKNPKEQNSNDG